MSKDLITYVPENMHDDPIVWEPDHKLSDRAFNAFQSILKLGQEIEPLRTKQALILKWFREDEKHCFAAGFENGYNELIMDPEFQEAVGFSARSPGQMSKMTLAFELGHGYLNMNLLGPGRSKIGDATRVLRDKKAAIDNAPPEQREAALTDLRETVERILEMPSREVVREFQEHRPPLCRLEINGNTALWSDDEIMLYPAKNAAAARVISSLCGARHYLYYWDKDGIWALDKQTGELSKAATWARDFDDAIMEALAENIPNCQRRMT